ncbi:acyltransferase [Mucilaginibacter sp. BJC16-A38]|uniref:acyltransferase family protein n=1 Tax=Mucilaginibacter phenanthrenivorans TaxID=1234842 RepID=UPI0021577E00|nr:acyltransferase [Mucilaginibacter phenanthrenivorans]MCR8559373.1 acyltransferase [Mucilaginibacter phenanthrenivorans]
MPTSPSALIPEQAKKIYYIDHLKVVLTVLVILHHSFITFGAPGGWYYTQKTTQMGALIPMTMFVAVNQAFFMGFFFFLSAYFIGPSFNKKGAAKFVSDRLLRLGLPLVFYSFILSPLLSYLVYYFADGNHITSLQYLGGFHHWIDFGVLWFVAALLLFTLTYVLWRLVIKNGPSKNMPAPSTGKIIFTAVVVGAVSFLVRTVFPTGWVLNPLGFQPAHFSQYIALFIFGLIAYRNNWLNTLSFKAGKRMLALVIVLILFFPVFYAIKLKLDMPLEWFSGGWHWQSLLYAVWEQVLGFSIITMLLSYGKALWNRSSVILDKLSRYTFAVYIFHPLVLISLSLAVRGWAIDPAAKLLVVGPLAVVGSFLLASVIVLVPGVKKII